MHGIQENLPTERPYALHIHQSGFLTVGAGFKTVEDPAMQPIHKLIAVAVLYFSIQECSSVACLTSRRFRDINEINPLTHKPVTRTLLLSFEGSGNTWTRFLIENSTGANVFDWGMRSSTEEPQLKTKAWVASPFQFVHTASAATA